MPLVQLLPVAPEHSIILIEALLFASFWFIAKHSLDPICIWLKDVKSRRKAEAAVKTPVLGLLYCVLMLSMSGIGTFKNHGSWILFLNTLVLFTCYSRNVWNIIQNCSAQAYRPLLGLQTKKRMF